MRTAVRVSSLAGTLLLAACTPGPAPVPGPNTSASLAPASAAPKRVGERDCASLVDVGLGEDAWRTAPAAGPAVFAPLDYAWGDRAGFAQRPADAQGWRWFKVAMRLRGGTPATVSIPAAYRDAGALTYLGGFDHTVAFAACGSASEPAPTSEFAGGFVVREALCLPVDVTWGGGSDRVVLDFGKGGC